MARRRGREKDGGRHPTWEQKKEKEEKESGGNDMSMQKCYELYVAVDPAPRKKRVKDVLA